MPLAAIFAAYAAIITFTRMTRAAIMPCRFAARRLRHTSHCRMRLHYFLHFSLPLIYAPFHLIFASMLLICAMSYAHAMPPLLLRRRYAAARVRAALWRDGAAARA
jgi:hypothetical protein